LPVRTGHKFEFAWTLYSVDSVQYAVHSLPLFHIMYATYQELYYA